MIDITAISAKFIDYKCFGSDACGFDRILPINLIVGRNNSGKSALLDLISFLAEPRPIDELGHQRRTPKALLSVELRAEELKNVFSPDRRGGDIQGSHWDYGRRWVGKEFSYVVAASGALALHSVTPPFKDGETGYADQLAREHGNPFSSYRFKRLDADRNIVPEPDGATRAVDSNGRGATNLVQHFINKTDLSRLLVESTLLRELNTIFESDGSFTDLVVEQDANGFWEIRLAEEHKGHVALSHTGSGLKTILLVLIFLHLIPHIEGRPLADYLFGFEELENNLHPALQRRLLSHLRRVALEQKCRFFLTTHSNIAIDMFSHDLEAQVIHVTHDRRSASLRRVITYVDNCGILDDLDVRASDLLQANGIVWLEGPSDRLYFNRWIELISSGSIKEGTHYQCVFYGGRSLAHLSASDSSVDPHDVVQILRVNRNAILVIDSDRDADRRNINFTKKRLLKEIEGMGGLSWLTAGREIENYIPRSAVAALYPDVELPTIDPFADFRLFLNQIEGEEGTRFARNKVLYAERVLPHLSLANLEPVLDWKKKASDALGRIHSWNGIPR